MTHKIFSSVMALCNTIDNKNACSSTGLFPACFRLFFLLFSNAGRNCATKLQTSLLHNIIFYQGVSNEIVWLMKVLWATRSSVWPGKI